MKIPQVAVEVEGNVVRLELIFRDNYEAQVYRDDICERLSSGDGLSLNLMCAAQPGIEA